MTDIILGAVLCLQASCLAIGVYVTGMGLAVVLF